MAPIDASHGPAIGSLLTVGTTPWLWPGAVRFAEGTSPRLPHDTRRTAFPVPSSPTYDRNCPSSSSPVSAHFRLRHGPCRHQPACTDEVDGPRSHLNHYALRADFSPRCL